MAASGFAVCAANVLAQPTPPIRPGLWEMRPTHEMDGQTMVKHGDRVRGLDPATKDFVVEQLKHKGTPVDDDSTSMSHVCFTPESLSNDKWLGSDSGCSTSFTQQDDKAWKWHSACKAAQTDGAATFVSPQHYVVRTDMTVDVNGTSHTVKTVAVFKWLGSDCTAQH